MIKRKVAKSRRVWLELTVACALGAALAVGVFYAIPLPEADPSVLTVRDCKMHKGLGARNEEGQEFVAFVCEKGAVLLIPVPDSTDSSI